MSNPATTEAAYRVGSVFKTKKVDFLGSVESISNDTSSRIQKNTEITKDISRNFKSIVKTQKRIDKSKEIQYNILERQEKFLANTNSKPKQAIIFGSLFKRILQKPIEAFQKLLLGLLIALAPKIISAVEKLINQFKLITFQFKQFMEFGSGIISNSINVVQAIIDNAINFDFTDESGRLEGALDQWEKDFNNDSEDLQELASLWELGPKELDDAIKRLERGEDPRTGAKPQETITGESVESTSGGATVNGTAEEYRIAAAIATEAGRGVSATDVLQVAANRVADDRYPNNFTDVFAEPGQFQGVFDRGLDNYRNIKSAEDASVFSGRSVEQINGYIADMRNSDLRTDSASEVRGALEFRAAPGYYQDRPSERPAGTGADGRIPGSSWRGGSGDNQILRDASKGDPMRAGGAAPINYAQGGTTTPAKPTTSTASTSNFSASKGKTQVVDQYMGGKNTNIVKTSDYGMRRHPVYGDMRMHNGVDLAPPGAGYRVALMVPGKVTRVDFDRGGYGNFVIISSQQTGMSYMFAHLKSVYVKNGDAYNGQAIGEIGSTGLGTGIHLHYEVYKGGKDGPAVNPIPYVGLLSIGRELRSSSTMTAKLNINDISSTNKGNLRSSGLFYDYDEADRIQNQNTQVVMMNQPIVARQTTVVNKTKKSGGTTVVGGGGGRSSAQSYNQNLMRDLA